MYAKQKYQGAYERYKQIVKLAPGIYDAHVNLGNIQESLQLFSEAAETYKVCR